MNFDKYFVFTFTHLNTVRKFDLNTPAMIMNAFVLCNALFKSSFLSLYPRNVTSQLRRRHLGKTSDQE